MIIVTGTKRSGTSMWMQILRAAGYPLLGDAFPRDWGETIRDANQAGFYESPLRLGIYYATNPSPRTGAYLAPAETRRLAVKVFASGLVKTDLAYLDRVVASVRHWREYKHSLERLYNMERENKLAKAERTGRPYAPLSFPPAPLEWWSDNYGLIRDSLLRGYRFRILSYESVLRDPERAVGETIRWLGGGDRKAAVSAVRNSLRTQHRSSAPASDSELAPQHEQLFDELYERVDRRRELDGPFIERLHAANRELAHKIAAADQRARAERKDARARARELTRSGKGQAH
jgi:hypothetical protein